MEEELEKLIAIPLDEYKELLIIKGKYEELSKKYPTLHIYDGYKEAGTTIPPQKEIKTNEPMPPYGTKIYC